MKRVVLWIALPLGIAVSAAAIIVARGDQPARASAGEPAPARRAAGHTDSSRASYSNIERADYVGPEACGECHSQKFQQWQRHSHSRMNLDPTEQSVLGDFSGIAVRYAGGTATFQRSDDRYEVVLQGDGGPARRYRVTRTIGSRFTQMYAVLLVEGPEPPDHPAYRVEAKLPFGYWFRLKRWLPTHYFDSDLPGDDDRARVNQTFFARASFLPWEDNCIHCHNTFPYKHRLFSPKRPPKGGFPADVIAFIGDVSDAATWRAVVPASLTRLGISCESCHFGGREHAVEGGSISFVPRSDDVRFRRDEMARPDLEDRDNPEIVNSICRQCHNSAVSEYPNGAATWNAREAIDLANGACASQIRCTDCHDPHVAGAPGETADDPGHVAACVGCHSDYDDREAVASHTRHSDAVSCLDCHMPRMTQGISHVIRTHRISSPTDPAMLASAAPNACNVCHLDESVRWTARYLSAWWDVTTLRPDEWATAYPGGVDRPVGEVWLDSPIPQVRLVATAAFARSPLGREALSSIVHSLGDPIPVNRVFGLFAVEVITGRRLSIAEYDPSAPAAQRAAQIGDLRGRLRPRP